MLNNGRLHIEKLQISGIPTIVIKPKEAVDKLPLIILYHGWSSSKENHMMLGQTLALYGYNVLIPDALHHGERGVLDYDAKGTVVTSFWPIIFNNIKEAEQLISYGIKELSADKDRIAVMGHSMGGFSSAGIFVKYPNIKTVININGSFSYAHTESLMLANLGGYDVTQEHIEELKLYDPMYHLETLAQRPMLIVHGEQDQVVPIGGQDYFFNEVQEIYKDIMGNIKFARFPRVNHYITVQMVEEILLWLQEKL